MCSAGVPAGPLPVARSQRGTGEDACATSHTKKINYFWKTLDFANFSAYISICFDGHLCGKKMKDEEVRSSLKN
jgi:hypothetical protein